MKFLLFIALIVGFLVHSCDDIKKYLDSNKGDPYWSKEAVDKREKALIDKVKAERCPNGFCPPEPD